VVGDGGGGDAVYQDVRTMVGAVIYIYIYIYIYICNIYRHTHTHI
jgi:hypothetical protein